VAGSVSRYLGISNKVAMLFSMLFLLKDSLLLAICLGEKKLFSYFSIENTILNAVSKRQLAMANMPWPKHYSVIFQLKIF
jgi:hypothetical protein